LKTNIEMRTILSKSILVWLTVANHVAQGQISQQQASSTSIAFINGDVLKSSIQYKRPPTDRNVLLGTPTTDLASKCPINNVQGADVAASCISALYNTYCNKPYDPNSLKNCHINYDTVFSNSFFKPLGDVCPAWKRGPKSNDCARAISTFSYNYLKVDPVTGQKSYLRLDSTHAQQLVTTIFASTTYAPCPDPAPTCNW
jgi:hypothetical protein